MPVERMQLKRNRFRKVYDWHSALYSVCSRCVVIGGTAAKAYLFSPN